jgi:UDP-N-acetylmuramoylalanine--D-glutamate ligase
VKLVFGCGISGLAAAQLLAAKKEDVVLTDDTPASPELLLRLQSLHLQFIPACKLPPCESYEEIIVSPGLSFRHPWLLEAKNKGIPLTSEICLALRYFSGPIISVTGTNGKSTTVMMIEHMLRKQGIYAKAAGNIGTPLSEVVLEKKCPEVVILELSSYQLHWSSTIDSQVALFCNFSYDHIGQHQTEKNYFLAKTKIFTSSHPNFIRLLTPEIQSLADQWSIRLPTPLHLIQSTSISPKHQQTANLREAHNQQNGVYAATACAYFLYNSPTATETLLAHLKDFSYLPHRFERIGAIKDTLVINDSKSTTVASTLCALESAPEPCILFLGGIGKGESFAPLLTKKEKIRQVYTFGTTGPQIAKDLSLCTPLLYKNLHAALEAFLSEPIPTGGSILFSPGCASFDEFTNFEARGVFFAKSMSPFLTTQKESTPP